MFNTKISLYGIVMILSIIIGLIVVYIYAKKEKFTKEELMVFIIFIGLGTIYGAKYYTFFTNPNKYNGHFDFIRVGQSSYGALIGILLMLFLYSKLCKKSYKDLLYIISPPIPLMYGIGKIGCFLAGCCYGIKYDGLLSITYNYSVSAPKGISLFPIQIVETIVFILIFLYINKKTKKEKNKNKIIGLTLILCSIFKFLLDYLRMEHVNKMITINQIVSLVFLIIGIIVLTKYKYKRTK